MTEVAIGVRSGGRCWYRTMTGLATTCGATPIVEEGIIVSHPGDHWNLVVQTGVRQVIVARGAPVITTNERT